MGSSATGSVGRRAEQLAFDYLIGHGLTPVARNFYCRGGEIDLIMLDEDCLTFVEVRFRSTDKFARASDTVDARKQQKIIRTAAMFVARNQRFGNTVMRFDVVAVEGSEEVAIGWIKDAFRPNNSTL